MSSAALQPLAAHQYHHHQQPAALTPPILATSPYSGHSSPAPTREPYNDPGLSPSPSPGSRRPSQHPSAGVNGAASVTESPSAQSENRSNRNNIMPPVAPPRTSSSTNNNASATRRRNPANTNTTSTTITRSPQLLAQSPPVRSSSQRAGRDPASLAATLNSHHQQPDIDWNRDAASPPPSIPTTTTTTTTTSVTAAAALVGGEDLQDTGRTSRSRQERQEDGKKDKVTRLGDYLLGNTIGKGEFGKVRLGWKRQDGVNSKQYAIKLIKKDTLGDNPSRTAKIWREVKILKRVTHPNIVKLIDTQNLDKYIGIILEYAAGGELFDYILSQRYLKENVARRLFAQLISGVGYLHKKGIVHRDLKLENLLLDSKHNIIITDFGFANTFDPSETLSEEEELHLSDKGFVRDAGLDRIRPDGSRKADLMQTSCGSPCYAAPELVISDSLYTGRKVDVWSCGVILYAMLAGYLPFDDDPGNPEGDNITQLYRYIISTPLTFPEPVGPGARDLLRRILVPNPRKRADLFEVARHSWLSEFADVVEFITSATTTPKEIQNSTVPPEGELAEAPNIGRSASVRETSSSRHQHQRIHHTAAVSAAAATTSAAATSPAIGGLSIKQGNVADLEDASFARQQRGAKRRTVQVEYVAPQTKTPRGDPAATPTTTQQPSSQPPNHLSSPPRAPSLDKPLPNLPPQQQDATASREGQRGARRANAMEAAAATTAATTAQGGSRAGRADRTDRDATYMSGAAGKAPLSQSAPPEMAGAVALGRVQRPSIGGNSSIHADNPTATSRLSSSVPTKFAMVSGFDADHDGADAPDAATAATYAPNPPPLEVRTHRRSNTLGDLGSKLLGRSGSLFGRSRKSPHQQNSQQQQQQGEKPKRYPPVSMNNNNNSSANNGGDESRQSTDSRRSYSLGLGRKRSGSFVGSQNSQEKQAAGTPRRFSFLPPSFSLKVIGIGKEDQAHHRHDDNNTTDNPQQQQQQRQRYHHQRAVSAQLAAAPYPATPKQPQEQKEQEQQQRLDTGISRTAVLQKHKRFTSYEDGGRGSGAARRVMALFRIRAWERGGDSR